MTEEQLRKKWPMDDIPDEVREFAVAWGAPHNMFIRDTVKLARDILELFEKMKNKEAYVKWLDEQIWTTDAIQSDEQWFIRQQAFEQAKEKFLSLTQPQ